MCPGGAYLFCSDREAEPIALRFAAMGYHAFVLHYSVHGGGETGIDDIEKDIQVKEKCQYPNPMREIAQSMLIIREHAEEWLVDEEKIVLCGFSAGAHNCAMYGNNWYNPVITDYFHKDKKMFRPAAMILGYPFCDFIYFRQNMIANFPLERIVNNFETAYLGENKTDEKYEMASPARNVTENTPPAFIWSTAADELVDIRQSLLMANALACKSIPFELHVFEDGLHGLALANQSTASKSSQINVDAVKWIDMVEAWLLKRFSLNI